MPEGPTVRRFSSLVSPFVGQQVEKVGCRTKQIALQDLMGQWIQDCQVHGKNLYVAFGCSITHVTALADAQELDDGKAPEEKSLNDYPPSDATTARTSPLSSLEHEEDNPRCKWLRFHFGLYGSIRVNEMARARQGNKRGDWRDPTPRLLLHFTSGNFLVFYNCRIHWCSSPHVEPTCDILSVEFDKEKALCALSSPRPVCVTLMDQQHFSGVGNIIKNEILFLAQVHPLTLGSLLTTNTLRALIDHAVSFTAQWLSKKMQKEPLHYHIYMKEYCEKGHKVVKESIGPPCGLKRLTWYCPTCQEQVQPEESAQAST
ncbi:endonuclease 8-like 2 [Bufo bufo]|uniref:endonuclease 8-like 2 n=1 Tax=Bufo bufo TaxID=8384 RepID=UPI001ABEB994|nr:endonuclease 8-like 2 [Bufo bufo]